MAWVEEQVEHRRLPGGEIGAGRRGRRGEGGGEREEGDREGIWCGGLGAAGSLSYC